MRLVLRYTEPTNNAMNVPLSVAQLQQDHVAAHLTFLHGGINSGHDNYLP